jgi:DNA-binding beta-propeller fold protein YncE
MSRRATTLSLLCLGLVLTLVLLSGAPVARAEPTATPHLAGGAALVLSAYPAYTPDPVRSFLEGRAVDMRPGGMDTLYGHGRLSLGDPPLKSVFLPVVQKMLVPVAGAVPLPGLPYSLAVNPGNNRLYVARFGASDVAILDLGTLGWVTNRPLDEHPYVVRVNPTLGRGYAAYGSPLYVFSCADHSLLGQIATYVGAAYALAVDSSNHRVYVGVCTMLVGHQDKVEVYNGTSNNLVGSVDVGVSPDFEQIGVAVNRTTGLAYAAYTGDGKIAIISSGAVLQGRITPSQMDWQPWLVVNAVTNRLYLSGRDKTVVIDLNSNSEVGTLSHTGLLAVDETRNRIYVCDGSRYVYVYDGATNSGVREFDLGGWYGVADIAYDPGTHRVLMAAASSNLIGYVTD